VPPLLSTGASKLRSDSHSRDWIGSGELHAVTEEDLVAIPLKGTVDLFSVFMGAVLCSIEV
jgi:hypothetical protein